MTPRPIHRWKSFWLGIVILLFLGWAWTRSWEKSDHLLVRPNTSTWCGISIYSGYVFWRTCSFPSGTGLGPDRIAWQSNYYHTSTESWLPPAFKRDYRRNAPLGPIDSAVGIAYWLLILLFLIPWTTFLIWRWRRMKRQAAGSAGHWPAEAPNNSASSSTPPG